ncbi:MAG: HAD family hydrolase [Methanospirillaceae archaeon]|nr:HAD family hydrolase [Methanospirillaceae archaeon]
MKAVILDVDGVLFESVDIKTEAFAELFSDYPDKVGEIVSYHLQNTGVSRYIKFRHIYENILHIPLPDSLFFELSDRFSKLVFDRVVSAPFVEGARQFVRECFHREIPIFLVSATPADELTAIIRARWISTYFTDIYGAPETKTHAITDILKTRNLDPSSVIFIGDSTLDYSAAQQTNVPFIGRVPSGKESPFPDSPPLIRIIPDLTPMREYL